MNSKIIALLLAAAGTAVGSVHGAVPGPQSNFDKNAVWSASDITGTGSDALATRGILFFDDGITRGAVDRVRQALQAAARQGNLSDSRLSELSQVLAVAETLDGAPDASAVVSRWIDANRTSPHRADMALLLADLTLEQGNTADALRQYKAIDIDALSPDLRDDFIYHLAYANLRLANYADAKSLFGGPALRASAKYANGARFYEGYLAYVEGDYQGALSYWENVNASTMPGLMADYYRSQIAYYNGNFNEALRLALPLLQRTDAPVLFTAEANRIVGESYYQQGMPSQAVSYLRKYVGAVETPERSALYILGLAEYEAGQYQAAVESLTPVTTDRSAMGQSAYLYIGQALLKLGDDNAAIMAFNQAINMDYDREVTEAAFYNYAVAKSRGGSVPFASSVATFEEFLTRFPGSRFADDVAAYIVSGYVTDGNYEAALRSIDRLSNPSSSILAAKQKVLYLQGARLLANDKPDEAVNILRQGAALAQYDAEMAAETNLMLGEALYRIGEYEEAAQAQLKYLDAVDRNNPNRAIALYDLGYTRMAQKEWAKAELDFERVLENPGTLTEATLADAQTRLGDARYYSRNWEGAVRAYDAAYTLNPQGGDYPLFQKAVMQGYSRNYNDKLATIDLFLERFPSSALVPDALMEKAEAYIQLRQPSKADDVYAELIDRFSGTRQGRKAYLFLAADQAGAGNITEAIDTYQSLIALASTSEEARLANEAVKRLHAENGTLAGYGDFIAGIDGAPALDAEEAETLEWNAAQHAYLGGKGAALLEKYVASYPYGRYMPEAVAYLLDYATDNGTDEEIYRWATLLVDRFPDSAATEDALVIKADIDYDNGRGIDALRAWEMLEQKSSSPENTNTARMGIMRVARDMGDSSRMLAAADALLNSSTLGAEEKTEASFTRALALSLDGRTDDAVIIWKSLADNTDDLYGSKAAVYAADALNAAGKPADAAAVAEKFVNSGTPHTYWLARGFLALSDAYAAQGRTFEAREYVKALKENYPGDEADIAVMIEERLK